MDAPFPAPSDTVGTPLPGGDANPDLQFLSPEELEAVVRAIPDEVVVRASAPVRRGPAPPPPPPPDALGPVLRVLILSAAYTGLRQSELLGLRWRDVDYADEGSDPLLAVEDVRHAGRTRVLMGGGPLLEFIGGRHAWGRRYPLSRAAPAHRGASSDGPLRGTSSPEDQILVRRSPSNPAWLTTPVDGHPRTPMEISPDKNDSLPHSPHARRIYATAS